MKNLTKLLILLVVLLMSVHSAFAATTLQWDASSGVVTGYKIYYGIVSGNYPGMEQIGNVTQYPLSNLPLQEKSTYYLIVKAFNDAGESNASNEVTYYCPDTTPPAPPQNPTIQ